MKNLEKFGFEVKTSTKFETLKVILDSQNPGNGTAQLIDGDVSILLLIIHTFGSGVPNKFFSDRESPQDTVDLVDDIFSKV
jgi:hypothetical protein